MSDPASRRGVLFGLAALPVASAGAVVSPDAPLLKLGPVLGPIFDRHARLWPHASALHEAGYEQVQGLIDGGMPWSEAYAVSPVWHAYLAARKPTDELEATAKALIEPIRGHVAVTLLGLILKARSEVICDYFETTAAADLRALALGDTA